MDALTVAILSISILLQLVAAALALRLIPRTKGSGYACFLIAAALALMAARRALTFTSLFVPQTTNAVGESVIESIALLISVLMLGGVLLIPRIFGVLEQTVERREAEVAELKQAREELRHERDFAESLIETAPAVVLVLDSKGQIVRFNPYMEKVSGYRLAEVQGKDWFSTFLPEGDRDRIRETFLRTIEDVQTSGTVNAIIAKDGHEVRTEWHNKTLKDADGNTIGVLSVGLDITERERAAEEINWLAKFPAENPNPVLRVAEDGTILYTNQAGKSLLDIWECQVGQPLPEEWHKFVLDALHSGSSNQTEAQHHDQFLSLTFAPTMEGRYITVYGLDITERKRVEEAERQQRTLAESLADTAAVLNSTLVLDEVLKRILANVGRVVPHEAAMIILVNSGVAHVARGRGYPNRRLAETIRDLRFEVKEAPVFSEMAESGQPLAIADTQAYEGWESIPGTRWIRSFAGAPVRLENQTIGFVCLQSASPGAFTPDHAERLRAFANQAATALENARLYEELEAYSEFLEQAVEERTEELHRVKRRVETILNSAGEALMVIGTDRRIQQVNAAFEEQTGYAATEAESRLGDELLLGGAIPEETLTELRSRVRAGQIWHGETLIHRKDGTTYDAAMTIAPLREPQEGEASFVVSMRDISTLKEVERMKDDFVSNVSHELRTPITNLRLYHDLLKVAKGEQRERILSTLERETSRLGLIIEDLLRLSRLDQEEIKLNRTTVDLNRLAEQYVSDRAALAESRGLRLDFEGQPDLPTVQADEGLVGQALSVVLTNALNYTPEGGQVVVGTQSQEMEGKLWAGFRVSDTGPGIPPEEQGYLFRRFFRGKVGHTSEVGGTGLGLAIAKEIVDQHSGRIEVESKGISDRGTTFNVWLPVEAQERG